MTTEMVTHVDKLVVRDADGRAIGLTEHSFFESASEHSKHAATDAQTLRMAARVSSEKNGLRSQLAEMRGHAAELQAQLSEAHTEIAEIRAEAHLREKAIHAEHAAQIRREAEAAPLKYRPVGTVLPEPRPDELASEYLLSLDGIERDLAELARQEGQEPTRTYWILRTPDAAVPVEAAS